MKQNYGTGEVSVLSSGWFQPERGHKGHYLLDLMDYKTPDESYYNMIVDEEIMANVDEEVTLVNDEQHPNW